MDPTNFCLGGADELGEYAGRYRTGANHVVILTAGDGHLVHRELLRPGTLSAFPVAPDTFRYQDRVDSSFNFVRGADDRIYAAAMIEKMTAQ